MGLNPFDSPLNHGRRLYKSGPEKPGVSSIETAAERAKAMLEKLESYQNEIPEKKDLDIRETAITTEDKAGLISFIEKKLGKAAFPTARMKMLAWGNLMDKLGSKANSFKVGDTVEMKDGKVTLKRNDDVFFSEDLFPWEVEKKLEKVTGELEATVEDLEEGRTTASTVASSITPAIDADLPGFKASDADLRASSARSFAAKEAKKEAAEQKAAKVATQEAVKKVLDQSADKIPSGFNRDITEVPILIETPDGPKEVDLFSEEYIESLREKAAERASDAESLNEAHEELLVHQGLESMSKNQRYRLPEAFDEYTDQDFADRMASMNYGHQALNALEDLAQIGGSGGAVDLFHQIRRRKLEKRHISHAEITQAVLGKSPEGVERRYRLIRKRLMEIDEQLNSSSSEKRKLKLEQVSRTLTEEREKLEDFFRASQQFVEVLALSAEGQGEEGLSISPAEVVKHDLDQTDNRDLKVAFGALHELFPILSASDQGPEFRRKKRGQLRMDHRSGKVEGEMDYSPESAHIYLRHLLTQTRDENGEVIFGETEKQAFLKQVNTLLVAGLARVAAMNPKDYFTNGKDGEFKDEFKDIMSGKTEITWNGLASLSPEAKTWIREGYMMQLTADYAMQRERLNEVRAQQGLDVIEQMQVLKETGELTDEELNRIAEVVRQHYFATAGLLINGDNGKVGGLIDFSKTINLDNGGRVQINIGLKGNPFKGDGPATIQNSFEFHSGITGRAVQTESFSLDLTSGLNAGLDGSIGVGVGASMKQKLDKHGVWSLGVDTGAGVSLRTLGLGLYAAAGVSRDVSALVQKRSAESVQDKKEEIDAALSAVEAKIPGASEAVMRDLRALMARELSDQEIHNLKKVQFLGVKFGAAVSMTPAGPMPVPIFGLMVGIKGKPYSIYQVPDGKVDLDELSEADIRAALDTEGNMEMIRSEGGQTTLDNTQEFGRESLLNQGIQLEEVEAGLYKINVLSSNGSVDIYTDPSAGIETQERNGDVFIRLDQGDNRLSIRRVNKFTPFRQGGTVQQTEIFISNNEFVQNAVIKGESTDRIHYTEYLGERTDTRVIQNQIAREGMGSASFEAEEELPELIASDVAERVAAYREQLRFFESAAGQFEQKDAPLLAQLRGVAKEIMKKNADRLDYKKLSTDGRNLEGFEELVAEHITGTTEWTDREWTFMVQAAMEESMSELKKTPQNIQKHIEGWNKKRLTGILSASPQIDQSLAKSLAEKLTTAWKDRALDSSKTTQFADGSLVVVEAGSEQINGSRFAEWESTDATHDLIGSVALEAEVLSSEFGLNAREASLVIDALKQHISPINFENPHDVFTSREGRDLLAAAELVFAPTEHSNLISLLKKAQNTENMPALTEQEARLFDKFTGILKALREAGSWTNADGSIKLSTGPFKAGFFEKCVNFAGEREGGLNVEILKAQRVIVGAEASVRDLLVRRTGVNIFGAGALLAVSPPKPDEPTYERPEEQTHSDEYDPGDGGKDDLGDAGVGDIEDRTPGDTTEETGGAGEGSNDVPV